ncbi:nuclear transport factor 2 family protein [Actinomadura scrupuli]|uniref:nuclear transport factor 2 family protein n=1 Tax=Actinomadura scrupuli TaxID=559629 RepID=UPI003D99085B
MSDARERLNVDLALRYHRAVSEGATGQDLARFLAPGLVHHELPNALFPDGVVRDLSAILEAAVKGGKGVSDQRFDVLNAVAAGDQVAMEVVWSGTLAVPYGPLPAGHVLRAHIATFLEIHDGRITAQRNYDCYERLDAGPGGAPGVPGSAAQAGAGRPAER